MHKFDEKLHNLLNTIRDDSNKNHETMVIFDLDSTLFNVTQRTQNIVRDIAQSGAMESVQKGLSDILHKVEILHNDWGVKEALARLGVNEDQILKSIRRAWGKHFFSNHYLQHDRPYPGAVEFVQDIHSFEVPISYLTGRHETTMKEGTIESLKQWEFPIETEDVELIMKGHPKISDVGYKCEVIDKLLEDYPEIWFFENEPVIIHAVAQRFPSVNIIFMDSVHSGRAEPLEDLPALKMSFLKPE